MSDTEIPDELRYTEDHEWARQEGDDVRVGITDYAQDALTDIVYVELPAVGKTVAKGDRLAVVESVKSVSDIYAPLAGTVKGVNEALLDHPETVNDDPYGEGWIVLLEAGDTADLDGLLDATAYRASLGA